MKLLNLQINKIRGIKESRFEPGGENLVLWGPNGSGKSAVVDALDFLLTGKISRLVGEGTGDLSLKAHGPHVDHDPKEAVVEALIEVPSLKKPILISRSVATPSKLVFPVEGEEALRPILETAQKGQHALSRRQILRFIQAEPRKRAEDVQALLDLEDIETIRKALGKAAREIKKQHRELTQRRIEKEGELESILDLETVSKETVLEKINALRSEVGAKVLATLQDKDVKEGVTPPAKVAQAPREVSNLEKLLETLDGQLERARASFASSHIQLWDAVEEVRKTEAAKEALDRLRLYQLGLKVLPEDGSCPLCGAEWELGELEEHIRNHLQSAREIDTKVKEINRLAENLSRTVTGIQSSVKQVVEASATLEAVSIQEKFSAWQQELDDYIELLATPLEFPKKDPYPPIVLAGLFSPNDLKSLHESLLGKKKKRYPEASKQQVVWDTLTKAAEHIGVFLKLEAASPRATAAQEIAEVLNTHFEDSRDSTLRTLYSEIEERFNDLYRAIHEEDEGSFKSSLTSTGAGLKLDVDFYGRGMFPPLAVHSEGHQDTMGLCLYLALAERLTGGVIGLTILDDVVMSVDAGHRRKVCEMFRRHFDHQQFLITTHDRTWARQLQSEEVVSHKQSIQFSGWSVETGPILAIEPDLWEKLEEELGQNSISEAAARLRRNAEQFMETVCDALRASVPYRSDGRHTLGEYASAAIGRYRKNLRKARKAAASWEKDDLIQELVEQESVAAQIIERSQIEQWHINAAVHYTKWANFEKGDFEPVVEAWHDLFELFKCQHCKTIVRLEGGLGHGRSIRCDCDTVHWNLERK